MLGNQAFWMIEYDYIALCLATCGITLACWKDMDEIDVWKEVSLRLHLTTLTARMTTAITLG